MGVMPEPPSALEKDRKELFAVTGRESQNILSWNGLTRINSWPCTDTLTIPSYA